MAASATPKPTIISHMRELFSIWSETSIVYYLASPARWPQISKPIRKLIPRPQSLLLHQRHKMYDKQRRNSQKCPKRQLIVQSQRQAQLVHFSQTSAIPPLSNSVFPPRQIQNTYCQHANNAAQ